MASPTPSVATTTPKTRPRRQSRFTEGPPFTGTAELPEQPSDNDFLLAILFQMDEHEKRKQRSDFNASTDSFTSTGRSRRGTGSSNGGSSPVQGEFVMKERLGRRSTFGRTAGEGARRSLEERPRELVDNVEGLAMKVRGRLRALTVGKERNVKPYPGT